MCPESADTTVTVTQPLKLDTTILSMSHPWLHLKAAMRHKLKIIALILGNSNLHQGCEMVSTSVCLKKKWKSPTSHRSGLAVSILYQTCFHLNPNKNSKKRRFLVRFLFIYFHTEEILNVTGSWFYLFKMCRTYWMVDISRPQRELFNHNKKCSWQFLFCL